MIRVWHKLYSPKALHLAQRYLRWGRLRFLHARPQGEHQIAHHWMAIAQEGCNRIPSPGKPKVENISKNTKNIKKTTPTKCCLVEATTKTKAVTVRQYSTKCHLHMPSEICVHMCITRSCAWHFVNVCNAIYPYNPI